MSMQAFGLSIGAAPAPDAARVRAIRDGVDLNDPALPGDFGEPARLAASTAMERLAGATADDLDASDALLAQARGRLAALDPHALVPRRGLAGLFDSRKRRLKRFRADYQGAERALSAIVADLVQRAEAGPRRAAAIEALHAELQGSILELDAHVAAGLAGLAEAHNAAGPTDAASAEQAPSVADRLAERLAALVAFRTGTVRLLPLARVAQNAECRIPARVAAVERTLATWRTDWSQALGLDRKRLLQARPRPGDMVGPREAALQALDRAAAEVTSARARLAEARDRMKRMAG